MHLNGIFVEKLLRQNSLFSLDMLKINETMAINKFQRSRLTLEISANVAHIGVPSIY